MNATPVLSPVPRSGSRRDQILDAAMECFASSGFRGTTTREIAGRVGLTEAALYRHFASKEALYAAIVARKIEAPDLIAHLESAAAAGDDRDASLELDHAQTPPVGSGRPTTAHRTHSSTTR